MRRLGAVSSLLLISLLVGCGASLPTDAQTRQCAEEELLKENQNRVTLVSFQRTNGLPTEDGSRLQLYTVEYQCEVEVTEECCGNSGGVFETSPLGSCSQKDILEKGSRLTLEGFVKFEKTEKGWRPRTVGVLFKKQGKT